MQAAVLPPVSAPEGLVSRYWRLAEMCRHLGRRAPRSLVGDPRRLNALLAEECRKILQLARLAQEPVSPEPAPLPGASGRRREAAVQRQMRMQNKVRRSILDLLAEAGDRLTRYEAAWDAAESRAGQKSPAEAGEP